MRLLKCLVIATLLVAAPRVGLAQNLQTLNIDLIMKIDPIGDGEMTMRYTLDAAQFQNWQAKYGRNEALLRRDMSKFVSQFETKDWTVQEKLMDRTESISLKIMGAVLHKGGGTYEYRLPKQWRGGERTGTTYAYNYVEPMGGGGVAQTNVKLSLPESATKFVEEKSETGDRVIQYYLPVSRAGMIPIWMGLLAMAVGAGAVGVSLRKGKRT